MRCYKVIAKIDGNVAATRIAGTNALAKETRDKLMEKFDVSKKNVEIEPAEVPTQKDQLIEFINGIYEAQDDEEVPE